MRHLLAQRDNTRAMKLVVVLQQQLLLQVFAVNFLLLPELFQALADLLLDLFLVIRLINFAHA